MRLLVDSNDVRILSAILRLQALGKSNPNASEIAKAANMRTYAVVDRLHTDIFRELIREY